MKKIIITILFACLLNFSFLYAQKNVRFKGSDLTYEINKIGIDEPKRKEDKNYLFYSIISVDCDKTGNIYVLDYKASRVKVFNKKGVFIRNMFKKGKGPNEISNPYRIRINRFNNHLYVLQDYGFTIKEFDLKGNFIKIYHLPEQSYNYFDFLSENKIIYVSSETDEIIKYNFKILNLRTLKIERKISKINYEPPLNIYQTFLIKKNVLWSVPPDESKLIGFDIETGKKVKAYKIKGNFMKNKIVKRSDLHLVMSIINNSAVPFEVKDGLYLLVTIRKYKGETLDDMKMPLIMKNYIYAKEGKEFKKVLYLKKCDFGNIKNISGNRLFFVFNEPYPHLKVITISK